MSWEERRRCREALSRARQLAYREGEHVGQENFMTAREILELAGAAAIGPDTEVLDVCCGMAGPGNHVARSTGARLLGVDRCPQALEIAREGAAGLPSRFLLGEVPGGIPFESFEVVLLLEVMLAFPDRRGLLAELAARLRPAGRLAFTFEAGQPLTRAERQAMPDGCNVHLTPPADMEAWLLQAGLSCRWREDHTESHQDVARRLLSAFEHERQSIAAALGQPFLDALLRSHRLWVEWMATGRVRKFAVVASRP